MFAARRPIRPSLLVALVTGALLLASCGAAADDGQITASIRSTQASRSRLVGRWPATTTTTTTIPMDPATGLGISGPIGPPWPDGFVAADAQVPSVDLYEAPGKRVPTGRSLPNPTVEGVGLVMLVRQQQKDWLQVQINTRPNGATAWIKRRDVKLRFVLYHLVIQLGAKRLTVFRGDKAVWSTSVAPGKASSPTPLGSFYVDARAKPYSPNGPYGAYQISFTGFSNVYEHFGSGNGQVAMHGTNRPELIGTPASHGCVRLSNPDITYLLDLAPQGTPVDVVA
jgi:lipoprotein-anchoring transpeptidase ErfK/SrfK